jgi:hypothetical protein
VRLLNLTVRNFRGFGNLAMAIPLDADLLLMFGPNGFGKTSLAEAVEWLFYGTSRRRQRGDSYSKNEFEGSFPNVHGGIPVDVTAKIRTANGVEHTIARCIPDRRNDLVSETFIDGTPAPLTAIGLTKLEGVHPVIAQHDLQSFIHSRPKDRRDVISVALGLDELTALKTSLDGAQRSFQLIVPPGIEDARAKLLPLATTLITISETKAVGQRWQKQPVEVKAADDREALIAAAHRMTGNPAEELETVLKELRARRQQISRTVFDTAKLLPLPDLQAAANRLTTETTILTNACSGLAEHLAKAVAATTSKYATALLQFWETGLKLSPAGATCPMCDEATLSADKRAALQARLKAAQDALANNKNIIEATATATSALTRAKQAVEYTVIDGLDVHGRTLLTNLMTVQAEPLAAFLAVHDEMIAAREEATAATAAVNDFLRSIPEKLADATQAEKVISDSTAIPARFTAASARVKGALEQYGIAWTTFEQVLAKEISSNTAIAEIDAVGIALKAEPERRMLAAYDAVLSTSRSLTQRAEGYLQKKQSELLDSRGKDVKTIYDLLNPGAQVGFEVMEPGNEQLRLYATSFGVRMSAAANLSECQLNCLGLSFWLGGATAPGSPFGFLLLDDPVQSMDDDHCEAFIGTLVPALCDDHKKQVILLSHERRLIDRIRDLNKGRDTVVYHYDEYERTGPSITQQVNLAVMLREVEGLAKGNEANRSASVDKLRKVEEQFIRELHLKLTGDPVPAAYDNATPSELLELFRQIPGTLPDEYQRLKDTCTFAAPAHHQPAGYSVPVTTNITPHTQRLRTLMTKYKLIL